MEGFEEEMSKILDRLWVFISFDGNLGPVLPIRPLPDRLEEDDSDVFVDRYRDAAAVLNGDGDLNKLVEREAQRLSRRDDE